MPLRTILAQRSASRTIVLDESVYPAGMRQGLHADGATRIGLLLGGTLAEGGAGETHVARAMEVVVKPADALHTDEFVADARVFSVVFPRGGAIDRMPYGWTDNAEVVRAALDVWRHAHAPQRRLALAVGRLAAAAPAEIGRAGGERAPDWWPGAAACLRDGALQRRSVAEVAASIGVHSVHLNRLCQRLYGRTTAAQLRWIRARHAASLLATGPDDLSAVAQRAGFYDQPHFCRVFGEAFGTTPAQHRRDIEQLLAHV